eukprot:1726924-Rhodomonas_salina.3
MPASQPLSPCQASQGRRRCGLRRAALNALTMPLRQTSCGSKAPGSRPDVCLESCSASNLPRCSCRQRVGKLQASQPVTWRGCSPLCLVYLTHSRSNAPGQACRTRRDDE